MQENWEMFFDMLIKHEGGFTSDERDSGNAKGDGHGNKGSTMLGVTAWNWAKYTGKPAPMEVMKALTKEDVKPLYKKNYWDRVKADQLPSGLDLCVFDFGVNAGTGRSAKFLQGMVGATQDGAIGPATLAKVNEFVSMEGVEGAIAEFQHRRQGYYEGLKTFATFGRGWTRRVTETTELALNMTET